MSTVPTDPDPETLPTKPPDPPPGPVPAPPYPTQPPPVPALEPGYAASIKPIMGSSDPSFVPPVPVPWAVIVKYMCGLERPLYPNVYSLCYEVLKSRGVEHPEMG
jgi:hypothetical protein